MLGRKIVDETGNRYGRLLVTGPAPRADNRPGAARWFCQCDCGKVINTRGCALRMGKAKSCGCINREMLTAKYKDETGKRYGRLVVIRLVGMGDYRRGGKEQGAQWLCQCDCGKQHTTRGSSLRDGVVGSCGCAHRADIGNFKRKPRGEAARNQALRASKRAARERGYAWSLTDEQAFALYSQPCHYCGCVSSNHSMHPTHNGSYRYNGIDRVDNDQGYTPENCVPCCKHCNIAKRSMTVLEFRMWIAQVYAHMKIGG